MDGFGIFTWNDGRRYEGQFKNDKKEGFGKLTCPDGRVYEGDWADGKQNGVGKYCSSVNVKMRKSEWRDGVRLRWLE